MAALEEASEVPVEEPKDEEPEGEESAVQKRKKELERQAELDAEERMKNKEVVDKTKAKFRGAWNYVVTDRPAFNAYSFLPTPPPVKPRTREPVEEPPEEEEEDDEEEYELLYEPPEDAQVWMEIRDRYGEYRGYIAKEGECYNNMNRLIGFINAGDANCGTATEEYLGCCVEQLTGNEVVVEDAIDERCGMIDLGSMGIKDNQGSTIAEIDSSGVVVGNHGSQLGKFENFSFQEIRVVAMYIMLIDPGFLNEREDAPHEEAEEEGRRIY